MRKQEELTNPNSCMSRAKPDEMTFVLLARDLCAPAVIAFWCQERVRLGKNEWSDPQITEALECARAMGYSHKERPSISAPFLCFNCDDRGCTLCDDNVRGE